MAGEATAACLTDETVALLLEGALPPEGRSQVMSHVDACESCRRLVSDSADSGGAADAATSGRREAIEAGDVIAEKYEVLRVVGEGGMGRVFEARHVELKQKVAVKVMHEEALADADSVSRFMREARIAAQLRSDHAARIHDVGRLPSGAPYLVMELLVGEDLHARQRKGALTIAEAVDFALQATDALVEAHALGLIHRDLKPQNLFVAQLVGGKSRVKVVDFGLAKDLSLRTSSSGLTADHMILGSPNFMSPEQVRSPKDVDARTDVWALGATLFQLLAGRPPFSAFTAHGMLARILTDAVPSVREFRPEVSGDLERVVARALEKDIERRFPDMRSFASALRATTHVDDATTEEMEAPPATERMEPRPPVDLKKTLPLSAQQGARASIAAAPPTPSTAPAPVPPFAPAPVSLPPKRRSSSSAVLFGALAAIALAAGLTAAVKIAQRTGHPPHPPSSAAPIDVSSSATASASAPPVVPAVSAPAESASTAPAASVKPPVVHVRPATPPSADPYKR